MVGQMGTVARVIRCTVSAVVRTVTTTGWSVVAIGVLCLVVGELLGMRELRMIAMLALGMVLIAIPWLLIPTGVDARLTLVPPSGVAGEHVTARIRTRLSRGRRLARPLLRVRADQDHWVRIPTLTADTEAHTSVDIPTPRRGRMQVGPVSLVRSDPWNLLRIRIRLLPEQEVYVRPEMRLLGSLGAGLATDLEGVPSDRLSMSDLAFHALREYAPGDDLRHVHWRSSARQGQLLVRQYHDTRRTQVTVVVDRNRAAYSGSAGDVQDGFELAASIAASLLYSASREDADISLVSGEEQVVGHDVQRALDALCRINPVRDASLAEDVATALRVVPDTALLFLVSGGAEHDLATLLWTCPTDTKAVVLRAVPGAEAEVGTLNGRPVITAGNLGDLAALIRMVV